MSTMKSKRRPSGRRAQEPPQEVVDRLAELLPEGALDEAVRGLTPEELTARAGCCRSSPAASSRPRWRPS